MMVTKGNLALPACFETHKPFVIPGAGLIMGGSCIRPIVKDADVYIGFDRDMTFGRAVPWKGGIEVAHFIRDMHAPVNVEAFKSLIGWTLAQVRDLKKVHCGCIGGHGRTGLFFAAMTCVAEPDNPDAVAYVREHYCHRAVESDVQIKFLAQHFGYKGKPKPTKNLKAAGLVFDEPWSLPPFKETWPVLHAEQPRIVNPIQGLSFWDR